MLGNPDCLTCDLSTCMAMLLHFDTLNQKNLQAEAAAQHRRFYSSSINRSLTNMSVLVKRELRPFFSVHKVKFGEA